MMVDRSCYSITPRMDRLISASTRTDGVSSIPLSDCLKQEHEIWLEFLDSQGQLESYSRRISKSDKAKVSEAFAEVKAAYFLDCLCECAVSDWEPSGQGSAKGDFAFQVESCTVFCEVKSPGWEREVMDRDGPYAPRLKKPKYVQGESNSYDNTEDLRDALVRAYRQLPENQPCLLVVTSDLIVSPLTDFSVEDVPISAHRALFETYNGREGCFTNRSFERCSAMLLLDVDDYCCERITYSYHLSKNLFAAFPFPEQAYERIQRLGGKWTRPDAHR